MSKLKGRVNKGWGHEMIWATTDAYCGKILIFDKVGAKFSMHFHRVKDESWLVTEGKFKVIWCDTKTATYKEQVLNEGDTWHNPPMLPHQLVALKANSIIFEVSTADSVEDNYRILPGNSQDAA